MLFVRVLDGDLTRSCYVVQSGGNGPHSGDRDDSIGLARAKTHAYAGLRAAAGALPLRTMQLASSCGRISVLASLHGSAASIKVVAAARRRGAASDEAWQRAVPIVATGAEAPAGGKGETEWFELSWGGASSGRLFDGGEASVTLELEVASATVFAIRALC